MEQEFRISIGAWPQQRAGAQVVRIQVFVEEQQIPIELEWDDMDALSLHAVAWDNNGQPIATGRLLPDGRIGRMAVSREWRGHGIGGAILQSLMAQARQRGDQTLLLHAQVQVQPFYARFGFACCGEEFIEDGIRHVPMQYRC